MTSILDDKKVREYFGTGVGPSMAHAVLDAMQQPIKKGDSFLWLEGKSPDIYVYDNPKIWVQAQDDFHPYLLRLPDRFQKRQVDRNESSSTIEEKIKELILRLGYELRELVTLARRTK